MNEFVVRLADERGRVLEQTYSGLTAEELRARFDAGGVLCLFRQNAGEPCRKPQEGQAGDLSYLQPAVSDPD